MQKAKVTGASEALGQHMLQNQPQELSTGHRPGLHLFRLTVLVAEADQTILQAIISFLESRLCKDSAPDRLALCRTATDFTSTTQVSDSEPEAQAPLV